MVMILMAELIYLKMQPKSKREQNNQSSQHIDS
jgi:hypothetical protein